MVPRMRSAVFGSIACWLVLVASCESSGGSGPSSSASSGGSDASASSSSGGGQSTGSSGGGGASGSSSGVAAGTSGTGGTSGGGSTSSSGGTPTSSGDSGGGDAGAEAGLALVPTSGTYKNTCDGSGGVYVDGTHFLDFNDETQVIGIYEQGASGAPVQQTDVSAAIGLSTSDEADLEDAARVGNRVYVMSSHGRNKNGKLETSRYKFFAIDLSGAVPNEGLTVAGAYDDLLQDLLVSSNWATPNTDVISALSAASQLSSGTVASLAPKVDGTNIEGFAALGHTGTFGIGFRNPPSGGDAIVVTLLNADAVIGGATAQFGQAILLNLGGYGIRGMAWSEAHQAVFVLSGPIDDSDSPFALWTWSGDPSSAPAKVQDLDVPVGAHPEAIVPYPNTKDLQILFDMGSFQISGDECKDASISSQYFSDVVVHVP